MWNCPVTQSILILDGLDKRRREYKRLGWVYAARNRSFTDPVFKVGQTKVSPLQRVEELSASTSVYQPFELVYFIHVSDRDKAESFAHRAMKDSRLNPRKEFFQAPLMTIVKVLDEAALQWQIQMGKTPLAGFLPPALGKRIETCPRCKAKNRLPRLLVEISVTCVECGATHKLDTDVPSVTGGK